METLPHPKFEGEVVFVTYKDRRRLDAFTWSSFEGAVGSIMQEHPFFDCENFGRLWLCAQS